MVETYLTLMSAGAKTGCIKVDENTEKKLMKKYTTLPLPGQSPLEELGKNKMQPSLCRPVFNTRRIKVAC